MHFCCLYVVMMFAVFMNTCCLQIFVLTSVLWRKFKAQLKLEPRNVVLYLGKYSILQLAAVSVFTLSFRSSLEDLFVVKLIKMKCFLFLIKQILDSMLCDQFNVTYRHAHPGSPYVYGLVGADHDIDFPEEAMPVVGMNFFLPNYTTY